jgi:hypothetical protein
MKIEKSQNNDLQLLKSPKLKKTHAIDKLDRNFSKENSNTFKIVYKIVFTGGP